MNNTSNKHFYMVSKVLISTIQDPELEGLETLYSSMLSAIQSGIDYMVPDKVSTTVQVIANTPESIRDLQKIVSNSQHLSDLALKTFQSGMAAGNTQNLV
jgi:hypothetical protein